MKNFINYYYGFTIYDLSFHNEKYYFYANDQSYMLEICTNTNIVNYYEELEKQLATYPYFFTIVKNKNNQYITWIDHKPYILLKLSNIKNEKLSVFDIQNNIFIHINTKLSILNRFPWTLLWENKIDYFEEWFHSKKNTYQNLLSLFYYFVGISENALLYFKETEKEEKKEDTDQLVVSHNRVTVEDRLYDYYDPTNIILDHASRDISEYLKSLFMKKIWDVDYLKDYLQKNYFSRYGLRMIYARILFPSFFFDYIESMIEKNEDIDLLYLEARLGEFQNFIKQISIFMKEEYDIPVIPWIIKKM